MRTPAWLVGFPLPGRKDQSRLNMSRFQVVSSVYYILSWIPLCLCASPPVQSTKKLIAVICKRYIQCLNTCKSWRWVWNTAGLPWHLTPTFAIFFILASYYMTDHNSVVFCAKQERWLCICLFRSPTHNFYSCVYYILSCDYRKSFSVQTN